MTSRSLLLGAAALALTAAAGFAAGQASKPGKGYVIGEIEITNADKYETYKPQSAALLEKAGGRYLVRGGNPQSLEGTAPASRVVVIEFDSVAAANAFYRSPAYQAIAPIRQTSTRSRLFVAEGMPR